MEAKWRAEFTIHKAAYENNVDAIGYLIQSEHHSADRPYLSDAERYSIPNNATVLEYCYTVVSMATICLAGIPMIACNLFNYSSSDIVDKLPDNPLIKSTCGNWPPLFFAAYSGSIEAAKCLIDHGADTDFVDVGYNFLEVAKYFGHERFVRNLTNYTAVRVSASQHWLLGGPGIRKAGELAGSVLRTIDELIMPWHASPGA